MGDFLQRGEEDSSSGKMLRFLTITALVAAATASHMLAKKIHKDMLVMNSMTACWGKGNMLAFKVGMKKAMETCMNENHSGLLKPANPLLALLSQNADTLPFPTNNNPFQSLPAQINQNPITKVFGRHMVFFKCAKKAEVKSCGMACANDMLSTLYGTNDQFNWSQYGLPQNKYERAAKTLMVMYGTASKEEHFVHEFMFNDPML